MTIAESQALAIGDFHAANGIDVLDRPILPSSLISVLDKRGATSGRELHTSRERWRHRLARRACQAWQEGPAGDWGGVGGAFCSRVSRQTASLDSDWGLRT